MPKPKFDRVELNRLLRTGKSQKEIAQALNVSESAISRGKKELKNAVVKNVALESAHKVVESHLDTLGQLRKINEGANELLDLLMRWNRGDEGALQILESQVKKVRHGKKEEEAVEFRFKDPRELALKAMQEIRGQLNLQLDIFKTLYDIQAVSEFQKEVLTAIGEVDQNVRARIIQRLKEGRIIRQSIELH
jgi:ABC-type dipeptide/oligopeptide/nickel transport system ATPase subunit